MHCSQMGCTWKTEPCSLKGSSSMGACCCHYMIVQARLRSEANTRVPCECSTPWQPEFCNWAFNLPRGEKLLEKWKLIPSDTDVLVTHTPPFGRGDQVGYMNVGCEELAREVQARIQPQYHVFGHVHEGYGKSSDGATIYMNASSCTHDYEAVNPAFVFDLKVSKSGSCVPDAGVTTEKKVLEYAVMLHEQLRMCSQKVPFVPKPVGKTGNRNEDEPSSSRRHSLREFRIDGTTSALLLESTLKLRPVVGEQTRALRYLFHNGFGGKAGVHAKSADQHHNKGEDAATAAANGEATPNQDAVPLNGAAPLSKAAQRRQSTIMRRITMAVLNDVSDSKELTGAEIEVLESSASTTFMKPAAAEGGAPSETRSRVRRSKTLQRRDGRARLASMAEEPDEKQQQAPEEEDAAKPTDKTSASESLPSPPAAVAEVAAVVVPPPAPVVECVLCKYKVSGHIHPGSTAADVEQQPSPAAAGEASDDISLEHEKAESERLKAVGSKRLSSWF